MTARIRRTDDDPFGMGGLANAPTFPGTPAFSAYIETQESQGQRELVGSTDLPVDTCGADDDFTALGFSFGEPHAHDPLFRPAALPAGWRREGSDHAMWSHIVDDRGRRRAAIFYKAAFYDREATMDLVRPTAALDELILGDSEPDALPIDDLLTADAARDYLTKKRAREAERLDLFRDDGRYGSDATIVTDVRARIERIDRMIAMLPEAAR